MAAGGRGRAGWAAWAVAVALLALSVGVERGAATGPSVTLADAYLGLANVASPTTLTPTVHLSIASSATPLYLVAVDLSGEAALDGFSIVLPSTSPSSTAPGGTAVLPFDLAPTACPMSPASAPGIYRIYLHVAASATPLPADVTIVRAVLVVQDQSLSPVGADWCNANQVFAITQDDGPTAAKTPGGTASVGLALQSLSVPGTFFLTGLNPNVTSRCLQAQALLNQGHSLGSHTYSHADMLTLTDEEIIAELVRNDEWIFDCVGQRPRNFRPPYGLIAPHQTMLLSTLGFTVVFARVLIDTITVSSPAATLAAFQTLDGSLGPSASQSFISDAHDYNGGIVDILNVMVPHYKGLGYTFVSFQECLDFCAGTDLCKDPNFDNGLTRAWTFTGNTPAARLPWSNPPCVTAASDPTPTSPPTVTPATYPSFTTPCNFITGGSLTVDSPVSGVLCVVLYNEDYTYLADTAPVADVATFASTVVGPTNTFYVEGYNTAGCTSLAGYYYCVAQCIDADCTPAPVATSTPTPTVAGPSDCVLLPDGSLVIGLPWPTTECLLLYDSHYRPLAGQRTINAHAVFLPSVAYATHTFIIEAYTGPSCAARTYINYLTCTATYNTTGSTAAPVAPPPFCQIAGDGSLSIDLPFYGSVCVILYNANYSYLAATTASLAGSNLASFPSSDLHGGTAFFVEGYANSDCTSYIGYVPCSTQGVSITSGTIPVFTLGDDASKVTGPPITVPAPSSPFNYTCIISRNLDAGAGWYIEDGANRYCCSQMGIAAAGGTQCIYPKCAVNVTLTSAFLYEAATSICYSNCFVGGSLLSEQDLLTLNVVSTIVFESTTGPLTPINMNIVTSTSAGTTVRTALIVDTNGQYKTKYIINIPASRRSPAETVVCADIGTVLSIGSIQGVFGCGFTPTVNNMVILAADGVTAAPNDVAYSDCRILP